MIQVYIKRKKCDKSLFINFRFHLCWLGMSSECVCVCVMGHVA